MNYLYGVRRCSVYLMIGVNGGTKRFNSGDEAAQHVCLPPSVSKPFLFVCAAYNVPYGTLFDYRLDHHWRGLGAALYSYSIVIARQSLCLFESWSSITTNNNSTHTHTHTHKVHKSLYKASSSSHLYTQQQHIHTKNKCREKQASAKAASSGWLVEDATRGWLHSLIHPSV